MQDVVHQKKRINRGVLALLATVVATFALIMVVLQHQRNELDRLDSLSSDYHLAISNKALGMLSAIDNSRLWFRDMDLGHPSFPANRGGVGIPAEFPVGSMQRDQLHSLQDEVEKYIHDIEVIQARFADPEFGKFSRALQDAYREFITGLFNFDSSEFYSYLKLDEIVAPLTTTTHQLQRLHFHAHLQQRMALEGFRQESRVQITVMISLLSVLGLFGVAGSLHHVRTLLEDQTRTQEKLQASEQYNRTLFEQSPVGLALCRMNGELIDVNPEYSRIIGRTVEDTLSLRYQEITPESYADSEEKQLQLLRSEGHFGPYDKEYIHKDGHRVPVRLHGLFLEKDGERYIWSSVEDITAQKWAEAEITRYREHLEELVVERTNELRSAQDELVRKERLSTLGQLTATVSHELRNPLGVLRMSYHIIERHSDRNNERIQKELQRIDRTIDRCDHIVEELLDFTRITRLKRQTVKLDEWLEAAIAEQAIPTSVKVDKYFNLDNYSVTIDPERLRRAVINVTENACQAMSEKDNPDNIRKDAHLVFRTGGNTERLEIKIADNGMGMPREVSEKIFEPLFSTKSFGVGLGMPAVKQIMEQHDGGIEIETEAGHGTSVTLWLPRDAGNVADMDAGA